MKFENQRKWAPGGSGRPQGLPWDLWKNLENFGKSWKTLDFLIEIRKFENPRKWAPGGSGRPQGLPWDLWKILENFGKFWKIRTRAPPKLAPP